MPADEESYPLRSRKQCSSAHVISAVKPIPTKPAGVAIANDSDGIRCRNDPTSVYFHPVAIILRRMNAICVDSGSCFGHTS